MRKVFIILIIILLVSIPLIIWCLRPKSNFQYDRRKEVDERLKTKSTQIIGNKNTPIYIIDNFLTSQECNDLIKNIKNLSKSTLTRYNGDKDFRTSQTGYFTNSLLEEKVDSRICSLLGLDKNLAEQTQVQKYDVGQQFKEHNDAFYVGLDDYYLKDKGQRSWTVMVYLNDVQEGGETVFTGLNESISPKTGKAVVWSSIDRNGNIDEDTKHKGSPVVAGFKFIITKWFH